MARKIQVPAIGGLRKVIVPGGTTAVGTTITELGSGEVTLAQLAALLANLIPPPTGTIGSPTTATLVAKQGLGGGGPLIGSVPVYLTAPIPIGDSDMVPGEEGPPGRPGAAGIAGPSGTSGWTIPGEDGQDGEMGPPGIGNPGPPGASGATGAAGAAGVNGWTIPGEDGQDGEPGAPVPGPAGAAGATGAIGLRGYPIPGEDGADGEPGNPGIPGVAGATGARGPQGYMIPGDDGVEGESGAMILFGAQAAAIGFANPTALVGLTAVNGSASTAMRSDAAPALDQSINPNWTGVHVFSPTASGPAVCAAVFNGASGGNYPVEVIGITTTNLSNGLYIEAGTSANDFPLVIQNKAGTANFMNIAGDGHGQLGPASLGMTWTVAGSFSIAAPTATTAPALSVTGLSAQFIANFQGGTTGATASYGVNINAGGVVTNDICLRMQNAAGTGNLMTIWGNGVTIGGSASPIGANTLVVQGQSTIGGSLQVTGTTTTGFAGAGTELFNNGSTGVLQAYNRTSAAYIPLQLNGSTVSLCYGAAATVGITMSSAGAVSITQALQVTGTGITGFAGPGAEIGVNAGLAFVQGFNRTSSAYIGLVLNGSSVLFEVNGVGICNVTGVGFSTGIATWLMTSTVGWTNGAGSLVGTLTNSPVTGNPTKWLAINDNGTTRHIPAW